MCVFVCVCVCVCVCVSVSVSFTLTKLKTPLKITLPVYLNNTRTTLVETLNFFTDQDKFYERGVAILCTALS